jgi:hypothetical protein
MKEKRNMKNEATTPDAKPATKEITFLKEHNLDGRDYKKGDKCSVIAKHADELITMKIAE